MAPSIPLQASERGLSSEQAHLQKSTKSLPHALQASEKGLSAEEAVRRLAEYGPNKLPEETRNAFLVYLS